ncbi:nucleotidyltransferase domain-containing protein [Bacillus canaveralius]|uniref:Nucleotidyltransferase domain-containing protein n=1 Tax=Bacillus canaveralius TaxID=1403243 RepID=A0A2N5GSS9_9BACI|nr:nucleotidyltransferase domain-containing protein [Bacillus canaveralius]PLR86829.1 nucleotidyltransferase domain-containing protein [Bacillus canaveralius]PLR92710.1 nucleotidyltransferase domain-containing protein [Bacillus canaveralius]RSK53676.1 nucleotidyltransferase domain-containing protein [Bacillus canaveralius]
MSELICKKIINTLVTELEPVFVILFGSAAKGIANQNSDLDIAFFSNKSVTPYDLFILSQQLADHAKRDVDLIDLSRSSTVFQAQIITTGKTIYCADEAAKRAFEMKTLKMYAKLNEERQVILDKIFESGIIYEK